MVAAAVVGCAVVGAMVGTMDSTTTLVGSTAMLLTLYPVSRRVSTAGKDVATLTSAAAMFVEAAEACVAKATTCDERVCGSVIIPSTTMEPWGLMTTVTISNVIGGTTNVILNASSNCCLTVAFWAIRV